MGWAWAGGHKAFYCLRERAERRNLAACTIYSNKIESIRCIFGGATLSFFSRKHHDIVISHISNLFKHQKQQTQHPQATRTSTQLKSCLTTAPLLESSRRCCCCCCCRGSPTARRRCRRRHSGRRRSDHSIHRLRHGHREGRLLLLLLLLLRRR